MAKKYKLKNFELLFFLVVVVALVLLIYFVVRNNNNNNKKGLHSTVDCYRCLKGQCVQFNCPPPGVDPGFRYYEGEPTCFNEC